MRTFEHYNAHSVREACRILQEYGNGARLNAGGTDLMGMLKDRIFVKYPEAIVNIKSIPGLNGIRQSRTGLRIGALVRLSDLAADPVVRQRYACLSEAAQSVASPQIRNLATVGGNLCQDTRCWYYRYPDELGGTIACLRKGEGACLAIQGDNRFHAIMGKRRCFAPCPSDLATALAVLDATISVAGPQGKRTIAIEEFYTSMGPVLEPAELLSEVLIPPPVKGAKQGFVKYTLRKPIDFAIVSLAYVLRVENGKFAAVRLALGGVGPSPNRANAAEELLLGQPQSEAAAIQAAEAALADAKPLKQNAYKVEIAKALVRRALLA